MKHPHIKTLDEIKQNAVSVQNANDTYEEQLSFLEKIALWITERVGSMGFFILIFCWTVLWLGWNTMAPAHLRFDPFPAFVLWLFISNMIQIFLMPLIMVGQNLQSKHSEIRADQDFAINKKAEIEVEAILKHLENQNDLILQILDRLDRQQNK
jgi:uncharacterized membrane protein